MRTCIEGLESNDSVSKTLSFDLAMDLMAELGTSVLLNWGEDDELWEMSWITGGRRFTGFSKDKYKAVRDVLAEVEALAENRPGG